MLNKQMVFRGLFCIACTYFYLRRKWEICYRRLVCVFVKGPVWTDWSRNTRSVRFGTVVGPQYWKISSQQCCHTHISRPKFNKTIFSFNLLLEKLKDFIGKFLTWSSFVLAAELGTASHECFSELCTKTAYIAQWCLFSWSREGCFSPFWGFCPMRKKIVL